MAKKKLEDNIETLIESVNFIVDNMVTKSEFAEAKKTLDEHTEILNEHTRDLSSIKNDVKLGLDQRLKLEVRITKIEKKMHV